MPTPIIGHQLQLQGQIRNLPAPGPREVLPPAGAGAGAAELTTCWLLSHRL
jgi:hypothetical protein